MWLSISIDWSLSMHLDVLNVNVFSNGVTYVFKNRLSRVNKILSEPNCKTNFYECIKRMSSPKRRHGLESLLLVFALDNTDHEREKIKRKKICRETFDNSVDNANGRTHFAYL